MPAAATARTPRHFTANVSLGIHLLRDANRRPKLSWLLAVENITHRPYLIAQEGKFSATQFSVPRLASITGKVRF